MLGRLDSFPENQEMEPTMSAAMPELSTLRFVGVLPAESGGMGIMQGSHDTLD